MTKKPARTKSTKPAKGGSADYPAMLAEIKTRIRTAQVKAVMSANREMLLLYWDVGRIVSERQHEQGWGAAVIPRLSRDIRNELPEVKGFSARNIDRMVAFYREYPGLVEISSTASAELASKAHQAGISPTPLAKSQTVDNEHDANGPRAVTQTPRGNIEALVLQLAAQLPWAHNVLLMQKAKSLPVRCWYMQAILREGWSHDVLAAMIQSAAHERQGGAVTNFAERLPPAQSDLAQQALKDPYIFDFLTLEEPFHERELEIGLVRHLEKFLVELGQGFAFVGRQVHLDVGEDDFYVDLLFYHLRLRCFVVIDLKKGSFKPEYAGKMNFYLSVVDDRMRHEHDIPSIGLVLCQEKNRIVAEYALRGVTKAIGVSEYQLTRALPKEFKSSLPSVEEIEQELSKP